MKIFFDFLPVLLFFVAYKFYGIFVATAVAIVASVAQIAFLWVKHRRLENMHLVTLALVVLLGGATLLFHDETFIKWKPTAVNWLFALVFLASEFVGKKNIVQRMMESHLTVTSPKIWMRLNILWVSFFITMGVINLYVAFNFETDTWVNFKLFGMMGLTLIFVFIQGVYLAYHIAPEEEKKPTDNIHS
jgi:intracellular septation protein